MSYVEYLTNLSNEYLGRACVAGTLNRNSYEPKTIQRSGHDDDRTIDGSKSSQQSTNDAKWRAGGLRGDGTTRDEDTQTTIEQITWRGVRWR